MARNEGSWHASKTIRYPDYHQSLRKDGKGEPRSERSFDRRETEQRGSKRSSDYDTSGSHKIQRMDNAGRGSYSSVHQKVFHSSKNDFSGPEWKRDCSSVGNQGSGDSKKYFEPQRQFSRPQLLDRADRYNPQQQFPLNPDNTFCSSNMETSERGYYTSAPDKGEVRKINFDEEINYPDSYFRKEATRPEIVRDRGYQSVDFSRRQDPPRPESFPSDLPSGRSFSSYNDRPYPSESSMFSRRRNDERDSSQKFENSKNDSTQQKFLDLPERRRVDIDQHMNDPEFSQPDFNQRSYSNREFQTNQDNIGCNPRAGFGQGRNDPEIRPSFNQRGGGNLEFPANQRNASLPLARGMSEMRNEPGFRCDFDYKEDKNFEFRKDQFHRGRDECFKAEYKSVKGNNSGMFQSENFNDGPLMNRGLGGGPRMIEPNFGGDFNRQNNYRNSGFLQGKCNICPPQRSDDQFLKEPDFRSNFDRERDYQNQCGSGPSMTRRNTGGGQFNEPQFEESCNFQKCYKNAEFQDQRIIGLVPRGDFDQCNNETEFRNSDLFQQRDFNDFEVAECCESLSTQGNRHRNEPDHHRGDIRNESGGFHRVDQRRSGPDEHKRYNPEIGGKDYGNQGSPSRQNDFHQNKNYGRFGDHFDKDMAMNSRGSNSNYNYGKQWRRNSPQPFYDGRRNYNDGPPRPEGSSRQDNFMNRGNTFNKLPGYNPTSRHVVGSSEVKPLIRDLEDRKPDASPLSSAPHSKPGKSDSPDSIKLIKVFEPNKGPSKVFESGDVTLEKVKNTQGPAGSNLVFLCVASEAPMITMQRTAALLKAKFFYSNIFDTHSKLWCAKIGLNFAELSCAEHKRKEEARNKALNLAMSTLRKHYYFVKMRHEWEARGLIVDVNGELIPKKSRFRQCAVPDIEKVKKTIANYANSDSITDLEFSIEFPVFERREIIAYAKTLGLVIRRFGAKRFRFLVISKKFNIWDIIKGITEKDLKYRSIFELIPPGEGHLF